MSAQHCSLVCLNLTVFLQLRALISDGSSNQFVGKRVALRCGGDTRLHWRSACTWSPDLTGFLLLTSCGLVSLGCLGGLLSVLKSYIDSDRRDFLMITPHISHIHTMAAQPILVVFTSHNQLLNGKPTGWYLPELAHPYVSC